LDQKSYKKKPECIGIGLVSKKKYISTNEQFLGGRIPEGDQVQVCGIP